MEQEFIEQALERLQEAAKDIHDQNIVLINGLDDAAFDPLIRLDCTLNEAQGKLTNFFNILKCLPYGYDITCSTEKMVASTNLLLEKIVARYGSTPEVKRCATTAGHAFRHSQCLWLFSKPPLHQIQSAEQRWAKLDEALQNIFKALDELNLSFLQVDPVRKSEPQLNRPEVPRKARKRRGVSIDRLVEMLAMACKANNMADRACSRSSFLRWERGEGGMHAGYSAACRNSMAAAKKWIYDYITEEQGRLNPDRAVSYNDGWSRHQPRTRS